MRHLPWLALVAVGCAAEPLEGLWLAEVQPCDGDTYFEVFGIGVAAGGEILLHGTYGGALVGHEDSLGFVAEYGSGSSRVDVRTGARKLRGRWSYTDPELCGETFEAIKLAGAEPQADLVDGAWWVRMLEGETDPGYDARFTVVTSSTRASLGGYWTGEWADGSLFSRSSNGWSRSTADMFMSEQSTYTWAIELRDGSGAGRAETCRRRFTTAEEHVDCSSTEVELERLPTAEPARSPGQRWIGWTDSEHWSYSSEQCETRLDRSGVGLDRMRAADGRLVVDLRLEPYDSVWTTLIGTSEASLTASDGMELDLTGALPVLRRSIDEECVVTMPLDVELVSELAGDPGVTWWLRKGNTQDEGCEPQVDVVSLEEARDGRTVLRSRRDEVLAGTDRNGRLSLTDAGRAIEADRDGDFMIGLWREDECTYDVQLVRLSPP